MEGLEKKSEMYEWRGWRKKVKTQHISHACILLFWLVDF
jgi:hypothetical protein